MAAHPPGGILERLLAETLPDLERSQVESHVEECAQCQETLHALTLNAAGPLSSGTSFGQVDAGPESSPQVEAFFDQLQRIQPASETASQRRVSADAKGRFLVEVEGYELLAELGRGAAGVVYRARYLKLNRLVALKVIVAGPHLSPELRQRFRREAMTIARLQHPNIVQIYDVGEHADFPFLSLELIEGGNLAEWMAGKPKAAKEAGHIVANLAKAVEYAHGQGVIHRDLKPANVLLGLVPGRPGKRDLKITDFGIAKVLPQSGATDLQMTQTGEILGTPAYMAPEQARGNASEICPATDVYSLGAMLYELLTSRPPFQGATPLDTLMQAAHQDPVPITLLVPRVPRDLNTICLKCLEKEPAKRYSTAAALAADLGRFLKDQPIEARPISWAGQGLRWTRRHRGLAAALGGVLILLMLLTIGSLAASAHFRAMEQRQRQLASDKSELANQKEIERAKAVLAQRREEKLRLLAEYEERELRRNLYFDQMNLGAQAAISSSGIGRVCEWLSPWAVSKPDQRNWEWFYLNGLCHRDLLTMRGHTGGVMYAAWSPDGRELASGGTDGTVRIWDAASGEEIRQLLGHQREVITVRWSPDGHRLVSASWDGTVKVWDPETGKNLRTFTGHSQGVQSAAWSPNGTRIASCGVDQTLQIWDPASGAVEKVFRASTQEIRDVAWSPDGKRIAASNADFSIHIWDTELGEEVLALHGHVNMVNRVAWSPDGTRLASSSNDHTVRIWDTSTGAVKLTLLGHAIGVLCVAWSPDGTRLATSSEDHTIKVWRATDGNELFTLRGHLQPVSSIEWSPDGSRLASASFDSTIKIWDSAAEAEVPVLRGHDGPIFQVAWSPDGGRVASASGDTTVKIWDAIKLREQRTLQGHTALVRAVAWSPDGQRLASAGDDHTIRVWNASAGEPLNSIRVNAGRIFGLAWSPDNRRIASAGLGGAVQIWDSSSGLELLHCSGHRRDVATVAWSPDGTRLATGSADSTVKVWDTTTGALLLSLTGHTAFIKCVQWSPDGRRIASASDDQTIKIWDAGVGRLLLTLRGHTTQVTGVAWSPDGTRLASSSDDHTIRLWDPDAGREILVVEHDPSLVKAVAWSPDGLTLASASEDKEIRIYNAAAGYVYARDAKYLPALDHRLALEPGNVNDWQLRAQIDAAHDDWSMAASDARHYLALSPAKRWCSPGCWVIGPYPEDLEQSFPPEDSADIGAQVPSTGSASSANFSWQPVPLSPSGFVNFGEQFDRAEHISAYALQKVYSPEQQQVAILLGEDDQIRLWVNGKQIYENKEPGIATPAAHCVSATLLPGWNTLLARVVNLTGAHTLYMRLSNEPSDLKRALQSSGL